MLLTVMFFLKVRRCSRRHLGLEHIGFICQKRVDKVAVCKPELKSDRRENFKSVLKDKILGLRERATVVLWGVLKLSFRRVNGVQSLGIRLILEKQEDRSLSLAVTVKELEWLNCKA